MCKTVAIEGGLKESNVKAIAGLQVHTLRCERLQDQKGNTPKNGDCVSNLPGHAPNLGSCRAAR
jgi:hypothetical protein